MNATIEIFKGPKKSSPHCCGGEVSTSIINSCCGTQEIPDDIKISFLVESLKELELGKTISFEVKDIEGDPIALNLFGKYCTAKKENVALNLSELSTLTPAVVINGDIKFTGRIPTSDELVSEL